MAELEPQEGTQPEDIQPGTEWWRYDHLCPYQDCQKGWNDSDSTGEYMLECAQDTLDDEFFMDCPHCEREFRVTVEWEPSYSFDAETQAENTARWDKARAESLARMEQREKAKQEAKPETEK